MAQPSLEQLLTDAGFPNTLDSFTSQQFVTVEAVRTLSIDEMVQDIGIKPLAAKQIYAKLHAGNQPNPANNQQIVPMQQELMVMKYENKAQMAEMEARIKMHEVQTKHALEMEKLKNDKTVELLHKEIGHQKKVKELEKEKATLVLEGKIAVLEEKTKAKPVVIDVQPPWWSPAAYGPWDPTFLPFNFYPYLAGSSLLTPQHYRVIQEWIGGYRRWELRYRGSRDGFASANFHAHCDNIGATVTLVRANGYLFGGYTPLSWNTTSSYQNTTASFLFSLVNSRSTAPLIFHSKGNGHSIYCHASYGPTFGGGHGLYISSNCNANTNSSSPNLSHSYSDPSGYGGTIFAGSTPFQVAEVEVFVVL